VLPYFLAPGYFTELALPRALDALRTAHPGIAFAQAAPLGAHPVLAALARRRAEAVNATRDSAVLLVAHGSADPAANAAIQRLAAMLATEAAFGLAHPTAHIQLAPPLGYDPLLAEILLARATEISQRQ